jgi:anti-sigma factor RsiW
MKACDEMKAALVELVFGELDAEIGMRLDQHLASCPECREEERRLLGLRDEVRGAPERPDAELRACVRAALPRERSPGAVAILRRPVPAYVAIAACLFGALLVLVLLREGRPRAVPAENAARPARVVPAGQVPPFVAAGSYETGVMLASREDSVRNPAPQAPPPQRDSL